VGSKVRLARMVLQQTSHFKSVRTVSAIIVLLCATGILAFTGCRSKPADSVAQPVTITFIGWGPATLTELTADRSVLSQFTQKTGIKVKFIVGPESTTDRLQLYLDALERKSSTPDVLYTDDIWPGVLAEYSVDLQPYTGEEAKKLLALAVQNDTVDGRLVALPFNMELGLLYYRTDLLAKYGFKHPPETWDELALMARRIQAGERAEGRKDFWGYVWQGGAYEGLTCNALEWQVSTGGGKIIEDDGTISVNNPQTVKALKMAKSWVGWISPPSVLAFKEADARNIWDSGNAAFRRDWVWRGNPATRLPDGAEPGKFSTSLPPSGGAGHASVLGGQSIAVSKYSAHPREAAELVRYLSSRDVQMWNWQRGSMLPVLSEFYQDPQYLAVRPGLERLKDIITGGATTRPSTISGRHYADVSKAYYSAVHSVLAGEVTAEKAMADLEADLVKITGFKTGKPKQTITPSGGTH
jgi:trehalose/maltose transport system substrate-binding protein